MFDVNKKQKSVLIVEPNSEQQELLYKFLSSEYLCFKATFTEFALKQLQEKEISVIISSFDLGNINGIDFLSFVKNFSPNSSVIFIGNGVTNSNIIESFRAGAFDFIQTPFELEQIEKSVLKGFENYETRRLHFDSQKDLEEEVSKRTFELNRHLENIEDSYRMTIKALIQALEARDLEARGHSERVVTFSLRLAYEIGLKKEEIRDLELGALLHDIGKISVPDMILRKPAKLNNSEWEKMKLHPTHGYKILQNIPFLEGAKKIILQHHECWDGKGYPQGLRGENIDIGARIFAVADAFDAMSSDKIYRKGRSYKECLKELEEYSGTQFDPMIVEAFKNVPKEDWEILRERSLKNKQEMFSFQEIVEKLIHSQKHLEMVH